LSEDAFIDKNAVEIVRNLQRLRGIDDADEDNESGSYRDRIGHRRTIHNLEKQKQKKRVTGTLDVAFKKRFFSMTAEGEIEGKHPQLNTFRYKATEFHRFLSFPQILR
jgi:chitin synthase